MTRAWLHILTTLPKVKDQHAIATEKHRVSEESRQRSTSAQSSVGVSQSVEDQM